MNKKRFSAIMLCVLIVISLIFATSFVAINGEHECTGADCHICVQIEQCREMVKKLGACIAVALLTLAICFCAQKFASGAVNYLKDNTPLSLKVKLRN